MALGVVAFGIVVIFGKEAFAMKGAARRKMIVAFILMLEAIIFFVLYSQMPTSLNFFAIRNVEHTILGTAVRPEQYQAPQTRSGSSLVARFWPLSITRWAIPCRCQPSLLSAW